MFVVGYFELGNKDVAVEQVVVEKNYLEFQLFSDFRCPSTSYPDQLNHFLDHSSRNLFLQVRMT